MTWNQLIKSGITALFILFLLAGNSQAQIPIKRSAPADNIYPYPVISETGNQQLPVLQFYLSYETVEEYWSCEYMMELPGTCIMTV